MWPSRSSSWSPPEGGVRPVRIALDPEAAAVTDGQ
jgi:hypothetical protein